MIDLWILPIRDGTHARGCFSKIILRLGLITCWWMGGSLPSHAQSKPDATNGANGPVVYKKLSLEELMDLDVTSVSRQAEPYGEAPAAIELITYDAIRRSGASSIPEALRLADNLDVAQQNSHDWNISARGFNTALANKLLVLIDGRTVYTPLFSGVFWDVQDYLLEDIDRIEVISGPGGTLWGANAVNGVINITTKSAKDTQGAYLEAGGGSELQDFTGFRFGLTLASNVYFRVYGKYFDRNTELLPNGKDASDAWNQGRGGFRIDSEAVPQNHLTLQSDFYSGREDIPGAGTAGVSGGNLLGRWSHTFAEDADMSLQVYYDQTHLALPKAAAAFEPFGFLRDDLDTYDVDFQDHFHLGERNAVVWGLGYRFTHDVVRNAPTVEFLPSVLDQDLYSGFIQDEIKITPTVHLTLGTKVEHNDFTGMEVQPSGRLQWNITPKQMMWGAVSRAVRTPSRIDHDLVEPTGFPAFLPQSILDGNTNFKSETLVAYELGYRAQIHPKLSTSISLFYNDYDNIRSTTPAKPDPILHLPFPVIFENNLQGKTYGTELSANYQALDWWRLHGGYNLLKEDIRVKSGKTDFTLGQNETADPQQQFNLRSSMDLPHDVELDMGLRWVDTLHNNNGPTPGTVPDYFEMDARLGWHATKRLELSLVGQNLLHDQHPEYGFPGATRIEIGRSIYAKASYRW